MAKSWIAATIATALSLVVFFTAANAVEYSLVANLVWLVPVVGAGVAAYLAPHSKFNMGAATCIPAVALIGIGTYFNGRMGFGDFVGAEGTAIGMLFSLPLIAGGSVIGALLGEWASRRGADA